MDLSIIQARWQLGVLRPEDVAALARELLEESNAGGAVGELAMLGGAATRLEVAPALQRAFAEVGLPAMSDDEARWRLAYEAARQIAAGEVAPHDGATTLWALATELGLPDPLRYFVYLAADYSEGPGSWDVERAWFDGKIIETARELLETPKPWNEDPLSKPTV